MLTNDGVVPHEEASRLGRKLEGNARRDVVKHVAEEIDRPAKDRLSTVATLGGVDAAVVEDADIVDAAIGLDEVVVEHVHVVVVNVDRGSAPVRVAFGGAVSGNTNCIVEIGNGVARDNVARAVNLHRIVAGEQVRTVSGYRPRVAGRLALEAAPSHQAEAVVAAKEKIVRDVEIARTRILGPDAKTDVFEATVLDREADRAEDFFLAGED